MALVYKGHLTLFYLNPSAGATNTSQAKHNTDLITYETEQQVSQYCAQALFGFDYKTLEGTKHIVVLFDPGFRLNLYLPDVLSQSKQEVVCLC